MSNILSLTSAQLKQAADIKDQIEALNHKLNALLGSAPAAVVATKTGKTRKFSAAGLARLRAAQKARWAKIHAAKAAKPATQPAAKSVKKKRTMSAAAKAKIAAAAKARWAKAKAAGKNTL